MGKNSEGYDLEDPSTWGGDGSGAASGLGRLLRRRGKKAVPATAPKFCWRAIVAAGSCDCMTSCKLPPGER